MPFIGTIQPESLLSTPMALNLGTQHKSHEISWSLLNVTQPYICLLTLNIKIDRALVSDY